MRRRLLRFIPVLLLITPLCLCAQTLEAPLVYGGKFTGKVLLKVSHKPEGQPPARLLGHPAGDLTLTGFSNTLLTVEVVGLELARNKHHEEYFLSLPAACVAANGPVKSQDIRTIRLATDAEGKVLTPLLDRRLQFLVTGNGNVDISLQFGLAEGRPNDVCTAGALYLQYVTSGLAPPAPRIDRDSLAWERAREGGIREIVAFVNSNPTSRFRSVAVSQLEQEDQRGWQAAEGANTAEAYQVYLDAFTGTGRGRYLDLARERMEELSLQSTPEPRRLSPEARLWRRILRERDTLLLQQYLTDYPNGRYATRARELLAGLGTPNYRLTEVPGGYIVQLLHLVNPRLTSIEPTEGLTVESALLTRDGIVRVLFEEAGPYTLQFTDAWGRTLPVVLTQQLRADLEFMPVDSSRMILSVWGGLPPFHFELLHGSDEEVVFTLDNVPHGETILSLDSLRRLGLTGTYYARVRGSDDHTAFRLPHVLTLPDADRYPPIVLVSFGMLGVGFIIMIVLLVVTFRRPRATGFGVIYGDPGKTPPHPAA